MKRLGNMIFGSAVLLVCGLRAPGVAWSGVPGPRPIGPLAPQAAPEQAGAAQGTRAIGTVKAIEGKALTLITDSGSSASVLVQDSTRMVRIEPGQKDLKGATPVELQDLQAGDRILVRGTTSADAKYLLAASIVLIKGSDIQQKQQQEQADWQKNGVGGLVKAVDAAGGTVAISTGSANGGRAITVHVSKDSILRRYASDSVSFNDAKPGTIDEIKPGDQLRARGHRSADGGELAAEEIVSGSFRNIAGTVLSVDPGASEITVKDLTTQEPVTVKISADSQMRKLPPTMAQMIAMRLKGRPGGAPSSPGGERAGENHAGPPGSPGGAPPGGPPDFQQMLKRLAPSTLASLQKGDAVMIVSTKSAGSGPVKAITLLSGVEPILTAPPENQATLMAGWGLGGAPAGAGDAGNP